MLTDWFASVVAALALSAGTTTAAPQQPLHVQPPQPGHARYGSVQVPRLRLVAPIRAQARLRELNVSVGHLPSTYWPGMGHTVALFAHRVTPTLGRPYGPFRYINRLRNGDRITVRMPYGHYTYVVVSHAVVRATAWHKFTPKAREELLIAACHPPGSAAYRYVVRAVAALMTTVRPTRHVRFRRGVQGVRTPGWAGRWP